MLAIRQIAHGGPEELRFVPVPDPVPGSGQVRVEVAAAGVHLLDTRLRAGHRMGSAPLPGLPLTPGREVAGTVDALGPDVDTRWLGRRVVAHLGASGGGYAEFALASEEALHELNDRTAFSDAIAMVGTGRTAAAISDAADLASRDAVLVLAAAGGLGTLLVQEALLSAGSVLGTAGGAEKIDRIRRLGVPAFDHLGPDWPAAVTEALDGRELTLVLDGVGGRVGRQALELLAPGGRHLVFGWSSGEPTPFDANDLMSRGITLMSPIGARLTRREGGLRALEARALEALASGRWKPAISPFPLADAAGAHAAIEARQTVGKVVLVP